MPFCGIVLLCFQRDVVGSIADENFQAVHFRGLLKSIGESDITQHAFRFDQLPFLGIIPILLLKDANPLCGLVLKAHVKAVGGVICVVERSHDFDAVADGCEC